MARSGSTQAAATESISPSIPTFSSSLPTGTRLQIERRRLDTDLVRSENLVKIASQHCWSSAVVADGLDLPHRNAIFDFAISIAVVHHLSTPQRRVQALEAILAALKPPEPSSQGEGGRALIFCWALEQKGSRRGWDEGDEQDIMVPWVMKQKNPSEGTSTETTFHRYYHLYRRGELERDILAAGGEVMESGYERDNWWAIAARSLHASIGRRSTEDENPS